MWLSCLPCRELWAEKARQSCPKLRQGWARPLCPDKFWERGPWREDPCVPDSAEGGTQL